MTDRWHFHGVALSGGSGILGPRFGPRPAMARSAVPIEIPEESEYSSALLKEQPGERHEPQSHAGARRHCRGGRRFLPVQPLEDRSAGPGSRARRREPDRGARRLQHAGHVEGQGRPALVRPGPRDDLRLQSRRGRAFLPEGRRARSGLRHVLVGRLARARPARQRENGTAEQRQGLGPAAAGAGRADGASEKEQAFIKALSARYAAESAGGSPAARRGLCRGDGASLPRSTRTTSTR